ncbi:MAG: hypothetical protein ACRD0O_18210 [Acidimicrobiia bacterium]
MRRALRVAATVGAAGFAVALAVLPVGGGIDADVAVIDSNANAAAFGLTSRIPAESAGGVVFTATAITLDKAVAKAAGATGGDLAETFFITSSDQYRNPTLVTAQYPPSGAAPAEASAGGPEGSGAATIHAVATEQPTAGAEAAGGQGGDPSALAMHHGRSSSNSDLAPDGTVVTRAVAVASGVSIGDVVTIASATTEAVTTVPRRAEPTADLKVTLSGLLVGGVPAQLTDQGLRVADQVPVGPGQLVAFNAALAQLAERGITVSAAPAVREAGGDRARAEGGALVVRYRVADQVGGDEELVLAQARSRSTLTISEELPALPAPLPVPDAGVAPPATPARPAPGPATTAVQPPGRTSTAPAGFALPDPGAGYLSPDLAPGPAGVVPAPSSPTLNLSGAREDPAVARLRTGYRVILLLAAAGTAVHLARHRTRLT